MKYCAECGKQLPKESKFCSGCGQIQEVIKSETVISQAQDSTPKQEPAQRAEKKGKFRLRIGKPFFWMMLLYVVLLIGDTVIEYINLGSVSGMTDVLYSGFTGGGFQRTTLMGIQYSMNGISVGVQFYIVLLIFVAIGILLSGLPKKSKTQ